MNSSINFENSNLHFIKRGHGSKVLLLFHGFGQHKQIFEELTTMIESQYTLYSFDLFFHGTSEWNHGEKTLEEETWRSIMQQFFSENKIEIFSLLGYSLGGKFVLATLQLFPEKIEHIYLLAPDGIKTNAWYSLATYPLLLRRFFKSMILKPNRLHYLAMALKKMNLVDKGLLRFAESQMDTQAKRERVYYSWVVFRHLKFNMRKVSDLINNNAIKFTLIVGRYDKIIPPKKMNQLLQYVKDYQFEILETGHNGVLTKSIPLIKSV